MNASGKLVAIPFGTKIQIWTIENPKLVSEFKEMHKKPILAIDYSNSGKYIVSGGQDSLLIVWDTNSSIPYHIIKPHQGMILSANYSPDDKLIAIGTTENNVVLINSTTGETYKVFSGHTDDVLNVEFIDNNILASCSADGSIILWDVLSGEMINHWSAHDNWVRNISIGVDKSRILSCGDDGHIKQWDISDLRNIKLIMIRK